MLITLLFIFLLLVTIFIYTVPVVKDGWGDKHTLAYEYEGLEMGAGILCMLSTIGLLICLVIIALTQIPRQIVYEEHLYNKEMLEYRLEHRDENIVGNEMLYKEITEFNNDLRCHKHYADNLWVNWFNNQLIAEIDYIEVGD